ncbi:concanavalin A-like lectin/glucanase [Coprinellus micaceus]|uniref:Concanavalin A-like lectin/glucanase n=1 Tax=Coprinellus micaceus TaxID=71717 RepID=A0A4Y7STD9_COPMI|nr:concanavalin A-like lectin/glucanase [Coprinellus micaceus]
MSRRHSGFYLGGSSSNMDGTSSTGDARRLAEGSSPQTEAPPSPTSSYAHGTPGYTGVGGRRRRSSASSANHITPSNLQPSPIIAPPSPSINPAQASSPSKPTSATPTRACASPATTGPRRGSFESIAAYSQLSTSELAPTMSRDGHGGSLNGHGYDERGVIPRTLSGSGSMGYNIGYARGEFGELRGRPSTDSSAALPFRGQGDREDSPLPPPNAPFMHSSNRDSTGSGMSGSTVPGSPASSSFESLPRSPSSASLYRGSAAAALSGGYASASGGYAPVAQGGGGGANAPGPQGTDGRGVQTPIPRTSSTASFRPFMAPPSRPSSSCWTPPLPLNPSYAQDPSTPNTASGFLSSTANGTGLDGTSFLVPTASKAPLPSTRLSAPLGKEEKPWTKKREAYTLRSYFSTLFFVFLGAAGAAALCYFGYASVPLLDESRLCMVLDESFSSGSLDEGTWNREVQLGGFGNGEFEMTTDEEENLFIANNQLYIHPTLTTDVLANILDQTNYTLPGCTLAQSNRSACTAIGSAALGRVINPVRSARINTKGKKSIRYGKVEVKAKMPKGDWLWPAIWMLPEPVVDNNLGSHSEEGVYGKWPLSGEIDLVEARGNDPEYESQGRNFVRSSLNYGPLPSLYRQVYGWQSMKRSSYDRGFHTFTLEWTDRFMRMYVDKRVTAMLEVDHLDEEKSKFPKTAVNGSEEVVVHNIWQEKGGAPNAPFDQPFYLIINLAAGGTSGWFPDGKGGKPWYDGSLSAMRGLC